MSSSYCPQRPDINKESKWDMGRESKAKEQNDRERERERERESKEQQEKQETSAHM